MSTLTNTGGFIEGFKNARSRESEAIGLGVLCTLRFETALQKFIAQAKVGPEGSRVKNISIQ